MDWQLIHALQLKALHERLKPSPESHLRYIFRWYSKTFHTPLHQVDDLPLDHVFLAWFDEMYAKMSAEDLHDERHQLTMTDKERRLAEQDEAEEEVDALAFLRSITEKAPKAPAEPPTLPKLDLEEFSLDFGDFDDFEE